MSIYVCPFHYDQNIQQSSSHSKLKHLPIYILFYIQLTEHANTELKKGEVYIPWIASQTSLLAAKAKLIMLLLTCNVKVCAKYQFLEETDEQCRSLCVKKPRPASYYVLHVTRNGTKSSPEDFSWSSLLKK